MKNEKTYTVRFWDTAIYEAQVQASNESEARKIVMDRKAEKIRLINVDGREIETVEEVKP